MIALGSRGDSTDPAKWSTFDVALNCYRKSSDFDGIGFTFANGYCGADLDKCINAATGEIEPYALDIVRQFDTYSEISPSNTGLHLVLKAKLPGNGLNRAVNGRKFEIYDAGRFFTITGNHLAGTPKEINERQFAAESLYHWIKANSEAEKEAKREDRQKSKGSAPRSSDDSNSANASLSDSQLMEIALNAANGAKFDRLWSGNRSDYADLTHPEGNPSRADAALVMILCFYSQDDSQVERLWKTSGLYRDKLERTDYVSLTIANARSQQTDSYSAHWSGQSKTRSTESLPDIETAASEMDDIILLMLNEYEPFGEEEKLAMLALFALFGARKTAAFSRGQFASRIRKREGSKPENYKKEDQFGGRRFTNLRKALRRSIKYPVLILK